MKKIFLSLLIAPLLATNLLAAFSSGSVAPIRLNFDALNLTVRTDAAPILNDHGIKIREMTAGTQLVLVPAIDFYEGHAVHPARHVLTQTEAHGLIGYTLELPHPASRVEFDRAGLYAHTPSGVSHPAWAAYTELKKIAPVGENMLIHMRAGPENAALAQRFILEAPQGQQFRFLRIDSNGFSHAGFTGALIHSLTIHPGPSAH